MAVKIKIMIDTSNTAFAKPRVREPEWEVARILRKIAADIEVDGIDFEGRHTLMDVNGHAVGLLEVTD